MSLQSQVWVVDDDRSIRWVLERALKADGIDVTTFQSADETLVALRRETPSVLVSDIRMPGTDGLTMLGEINSRYPEMPVIIMTAYSDLDSAVSAYQGGAFEYLPKPFDVDEALSLVRRALEQARAADRTRACRQSCTERNHRFRCRDAGRVSGDRTALPLEHHRIDHRRIWNR